MKELVGRRVDAIDVEKAKQEYIIFHTDTGPICYAALPDCCSETWFADILGIERILGKVIGSVEEIEVTDFACRLIERDGRGRQESDKVYGISLGVAGGCGSGCEIVFRNSSNGYYGGCLSGPIDIPKERGDSSAYASGHEQLEWERITKDWSAGEPKEA